MVSVLGLQYGGMRINYTDGRFLKTLLFRETRAVELIKCRGNLKADRELLKQELNFKIGGITTF